MPTVARQSEKQPENGKAGREVIAVALSMSTTCERLT